MNKQQITKTNRVKVLTAKIEAEGFSCCTISEAGAGVIPTDTIRQKHKVSPLWLAKARVCIGTVL